MKHIFEELDYQETPHGEISLRRRSEPRLDNLVLYEVKLGEEFLMSSLFVEAEIQLSKLGLAALEGNNLDVIVGGLGLGFTAAAALEDSRVKSLNVIDVMKPVIEWHQKKLVPLGEQLSTDVRCQLTHADFFEAIASEQTFEKVVQKSKVHAIFLDIDHSPKHWLNPQNKHFYSHQGLSELADRLHVSGVFGLWSNDPPDADFMELLEHVFERVSSHVVTFDNPYQGGESLNTIYLGHKTGT